MSDQDTEKIGKIINGYKLIKFLGKGKFSTVFHAECQNTKKFVAIKIIKVSKLYIC